jgi:hypothetical protein
MAALAEDICGSGDGLVGGESDANRGFTWMGLDGHSVDLAVEIASEPWAWNTLYLACWPSRGIPGKLQAANDFGFRLQMIFQMIFVDPAFGDLLVWTNVTRLSPWDASFFRG